MKQVFPALHNSALSLSLIIAFAGPGFAQDIADTLYTGGAIITMNDEAPFAEAVAVKEGRILAVGQLSEIIRHQSEKTAVFDLNGQTMLPGFVDSHGHVILGGLQALSANLLAPLDGNVTDIASLQDTLRGWIAANGAVVERTNLIVGFGYDEISTG